MAARLMILWTLVATTAVAAPTLDAPASAGVGSTVDVKVAGSTNARDFVTIVPKGTREGAYGDYQYVEKRAVLKLKAPAKPGEYEIRLLGADAPYPTLARRPIRIDEVEATLDAPEHVEAGAKFQVKWTGPDNARDYVAIGNAKRQYITYAYTTAGQPRLARRARTRRRVRAALFPRRRRHRHRQAAARRRRRHRYGHRAGQGRGWRQVPGHVEGAEQSARLRHRSSRRARRTNSTDAYEYTSKGSPLELRAPDVAGEYEVRYLTAQTYATLGSHRSKSPPSAPPSRGRPRRSPAVRSPSKWQGPNNVNDYVTIVQKGASEGDSGNYRYTAHGNPAKILAPVEPGEYELRYSTGQSNATLARAPIRITPGEEEPGFVEVTVGAAGRRRQCRRDHPRRLGQHAAEDRRGAAHRHRQADADAPDHARHSRGHAVRVARVRARGGFLPVRSRHRRSGRSMRARSAPRSRSSRRRTTRRRRSAHRSRRSPTTCAVRAASGS